MLEKVGRKTPVDELPVALPTAVGQTDLVRAKAYAAAAFESECDRLRKAPPHQRNNTLNHCAFKLGRHVARALLESARVTSALTNIAKLIGLDDREIALTVESGLRAGMKNPARLPFEKGNAASDSASRPSASDDELTEQLAALGEDDIANAERFVRRYGNKVLYSKTRGFLVYDGKRYRPDDRFMCVELAKNVVQKIEDEVPLMSTEDARKRRSAHAKQSRSKAAIDRMLDLSKGRLFVEDTSLDANPWLLNTETFTIDLRTSQYNPHDARDLITKISQVKAKPGSKCPVFDTFLKRISDGDDEMVAFIQKAVGYTLTGTHDSSGLFLRLRKEREKRQVYAYKPHSRDAGRLRSTHSDRNPPDQKLRQRNPCRLSAPRRQENGDGR